MECGLPGSSVHGILLILFKALQLLLSTQFTGEGMKAEWEFVCHPMSKSYEATQPLWKTVGKILKKVKNRATLWSSNAISEYRCGGNCHSLERYLHPHVHGSIIHNHKGMEATQVFADWHMGREMWRVYGIKVEYCSPRERRKSCHWQEHKWTLWTL